MVVDPFQVIGYIARLEAKILECRQFPEFMSVDGIWLATDRASVFKAGF